MKAVDAHGLHSPFLFELYNQVIRARNTQEEKRLKALRRELSNLSGELTYLDPKTHKKRTVDLRRFGRTSASSHRFSYFLYKLINHLSFQSILETGTCTGVNAAYLSQTTASNIWSIEGSKELAKIASENLSKNNISNVNISVGNVWEQFPTILDLFQPELVFLDADHRSETIEFYLNTIKSHAQTIKCIVIHDIHWSPDMSKVWQSIIQRSEYKLTIDIFQAGIIFPDYPIEKQHFVVKF